MTVGAGGGRRQVEHSPAHALPALQRHWIRGSQRPPEPDPPPPATPRGAAVQMTAVPTVISGPAPARGVMGASRRLTGPDWHVPSENLQLMVELGDRSAQGRACGNLGNTHYLLGNFTQAISYHQQVRQGCAPWP